MNPTRGLVFLLALTLGCSADTGQKVGISGTVSRGGTAKPAGDGARVTHVMAVTASSQNTRRVLAEVAADGSFALEVDPARPWVIVFLDATKIGADMILGIFKAQELDSLPPRAGATDVQLGNVSLVDGAASGDVSYTALLAALGIDAATAADVGALDDVCLRYVNPDVDGDGVIDATQPGHEFGLDFHVQLALDTAGRRATVADLVSAFLPEDSWPTYGGTGIYVSFPHAYAESGHATVRFDEPAAVSRYGANPGMTWIPAGTEISGAEIIANHYGDMRSFGVYALPGRQLPQGRYRFAIDGRELTFEHVRTSSDAMLSGTQGFILPFVRLVPTETGCRTACTIARVEYEWRRHVDGLWRAATAEELALLTADQGGYLSIRRGRDDSDDVVGVAIPVEAPAGTLDAPGIVGMSSADICHLGLSVDDKLGMRAFAGIANSPGTCGE